MEISGLNLDPLPQERLVLRQLAGQVVEIAALPVQAERSRLWQKMNALQAERPLVLANPQNGWCELLSDEELVCSHPLLREWEMTLRRLIYRHQYIHDDWPVTNRFDVNWVVDVGGYGLQETQIRSEARGSACGSVRRQAASDRADRRHRV